MAPKTPKQKIKFLTNPEGDGILSTKYADIFSIDFLPDNIKAHDLEGIKQSIRDYGFVEPIGINRKTGNDIFGNGRLQALQEMIRSGEECPKGIIEKSGKRPNPNIEMSWRVWYAPIVDGLNFDEQQEIDLAIRMNRIAEKGGIDPAKAVAVLKRIAEESPERLVSTGYTAEDIDKIRAIARFQQQMQTTQKPSESEEPREFHDGDLGKTLNDNWQVRSGDFWQIGYHILACVDSVDHLALQYRFTSPVRLVFTSPPYDNQRTYESEEKFDWTALMNGVTDTIFKLLGNPGDVIVNLGMVHEDKQVKFYWNEWLEYCKEIGHPCFGLYPWDKLIGYPGEYHGRLASAHEFFFHFKVGSAKANKWIETTGEAIRRGPTNWGARQTDGKVRQGLESPDKLGQSHKIPDSVIRMYAEMGRGIHTQGHPATFPVGLPEFFIQTFTAAGDVVYDPFAGSGTTLVACQHLDRIGYASEISPNYCALILERMKQEFPDLEIKKL